MAAENLLPQGFDSRTVQPVASRSCNTVGFCRFLKLHVVTHLCDKDFTYGSVIVLENWKLKMEVACEKCLLLSV